MSLTTLGLWGDGDEVCAIEDAFVAIAVVSPVEDASKWLTVGDLWSSVARVAPATAASAEAWDAFRQALAQETCVEWTLIECSTALLDGRGHNVLSRLWTAVRERLSANA